MQLAALLSHVHERDGAVIGCPRFKGSVHGRLEIIAGDQRIKEQVLPEEGQQIAAQRVVPCPGDPTSKATVIAGVHRIMPYESQAGLRVAGERSIQLLLDPLDGGSE